MMDEKNHKEIKRGFTKFKTMNWDYISLFLLIFGFILLIIGFWETETILWNRIKYTTGSQWTNANPIYLNTPLSDLVALLTQNFIYYIIGNLFVLISAVIMIYQYIIRKSWFKTSKIFLIFLTVVSVTAALMGFWQKFSIDVIESLEAPLGETKTGEDWIRGEIGTEAAIIEAFSLTFWISSLIISSVSIFVIFRKWYQVRKRKRNIELNMISSNSGKSSLLNRKESDNRSFKKSFKLALKNFTKNIPFYITLLGYLAFTLFPVYLAVIASFSTPDEISQAKPPGDPLETMILNYSSVMFVVQKATPSFRTALFYSLFLGLGTSFLSLAISVTSAYALARLKFRGKTFLSFIILSTQMFPAIILLIPQFVIMSDLGLLERDVVLFGVLLVMSTGATAYVTWMMKGYFETIPPDIEEAAYIDGYGRFSTFIKIVIPLAKSGMVAVMVFVFLSAWQEFVLARTFIGVGDPLATLPLLFYQFQNLNAPDVPTFYELLSPYSILVAAPVVAFYLILQRQLVGGVVAGAVK